MFVGFVSDDVKVLPHLIFNLKEIIHSFIMNVKSILNITYAQRPEIIQVQNDNRFLL